MQKQTSSPQTETESLNVKLPQADKKVETRIVELSYKSCCGCGCSYESVYRRVPADSDLQDGDIIQSMESGDEWDREDLE